jgi:Spy/CpxP family protein refolding chaperone
MIARLARPILALASIALLGSISLAQQPPAPPAPPDSSAPAAAPIERQPPSPPMRPGMGQNMRPGLMQQNMDQRMRRVQMMRDHAALRIGPPGMWWKNPNVVQKLTLTADQTKKMDDIFQQSRLQLIDLKANVEKQQVMLEPLLSSNPVDTSKAMAQIDKVAEARADLEKANAKMLLGIRAVLTPDQWTKLRDHQFGGPGAQGGPGGPGGPMGTDGPGGPGGGPRTRGMRGGGQSPNTTNNLIEPIDVP